MHALIDGDRLPYAFGGFKDEDGYPLGWPLVAERVDTNIRNILSAASATSFSIYLTSDDKSNYRIGIATIRPYKGNRSSDKPFWYESIRRYLISEYKAEVVHGLEADDALGIEQMKQPNTVIASVDKDLDMIPGLHYNELHPERGIYEIPEEESLRNFYHQLLTGDPVDNILGLYGIGRKSKVLHHLDSMVEELDMYSHVRREYEKRFGSYAKQFMHENGILLWIKRSQEPVGEMEVLERLGSLNEKYLGSLESEVDLKIELSNN